MSGQKPKGGCKCGVADFLALQPVPTARSGALLRLMGHLVWPYSKFWTPAGLVPASRVIYSPQFATPFVLLPPHFRLTL